jgi:hypothetical protein
MLTQPQKVAIRRHLSVPFAGTAQAGRLYGWRFTFYSEDLEYRMNNMQPAEEQLITGNALAVWRMDGRPTVGDVLTFTVTDTVNGTMTATYTVQQSDFDKPADPVNPSDSSPLYSIALNASLAINNVMASKGYSAVGVMPADLASPQYMPPYFSEIDLSGPSSATFTIGVSRTGTTNTLIAQQATTCPVKATLSGQTLYGYVAVIDSLAMGMAQSDLSLTYEKADVVQFRRDEIPARRALYAEYCTMLSRDLGGKEYVNKLSGGSGGGAVA